jgi:hypothetical protein
MFGFALSSLPLQLAASAGSAFQTGSIIDRTANHGCGLAWRGLGRPPAIGAGKTLLKFWHAVNISKPEMILIPDTSITRLYITLPG